jgi:hypothetical protein
MARRKKNAPESIVRDIKRKTSRKFTKRDCTICDYMKSIM